MMPFKRTALFAMAAALVLFFTVQSMAQDATTAAPDAAKQQEEKAKLENKAAVLLEQVIGEAQALKLPENRIRVQVSAADLLWDRSAARARTLFNDAGAMLAQMMTDTDNPDRDDRQILNRLRQELVLTAARHDGELAYHLLRQTQPPATTTTNNTNRRMMRFDQGDNLEQSLLAVIANTDPKMAYQKAAESLDKGEYPTSLNRVLSQLKAKDQEAYKKLADKTLVRLGSDNLLSSTQASALAMSLLRPGPAPASTSTAPARTSANSTVNNGPVLDETAFHDLLNNAITAALSATPRTNANGNGNPRRQMRTSNMMIMNDTEGGAFSVFADGSNDQNPPDPAQVQQNSARNLLRGLQGMLAQVDQYLPERGSALRQKLTEMGMGENSMANFANQMRNVAQQGDSESLFNAAENAPPPIQSRLYQQAAQKAVDEGNTDRALQIANDHLDEGARNTINQAIDFKKLTVNVSPEKMGEIRQKLAALPSDAERIKYLADLANATQKDNPKLAQKFAEDARSLVSKRASDYADFENQLRVAELFASIDPKRSFEVLEPGITQLNELLAAAQVLSGFEVEVFHDGELPLQGYSELGRMVSRYGQVLATLAKLDFERAQITADRFQLAEPRLLAKLTIVQGAFGVRSTWDNRRGPNFQFTVR